MLHKTSFLRSEIPGIPIRRGKVRDVYEFGERLLIVATDRISAFDWVMPNGIPDKGRILTGISLMWFDRLETKNHFLSANPEDVRLPANVDPEPLRGRSMVVKKTEVVPIECVARGYLAGSGWKEYQRSQTICGIPLPSGLVEGDRLPEPIFTPATKAQEGHDENISFDRMRELVGHELSTTLRETTLGLFARAGKYASARGLILADTKFEFGLIDGKPILIDEALTPDSSRYWATDTYQPGQAQPSFDKQFVRDWLDTTGWDKNSPPPSLPDEIVERTREKYIEAYEWLLGHEFPWK
ncbi:MAG TPA: phosphoribosylaminoimidazolesuccinocarboxamide synthase [Planctomycetaceae bacterium]|nr:phosphoribosylaminoimidazolesuccinocarboxamide synthase [Planctomycetaceae bacterium]